MAIQGIKTSVGVRELHNHTSELLKAVVESGEALEVTVHNKPVARIVPIDENDPLEKLRRRGLIREGKPGSGWKPSPIKLEGGATVSDLVKEQRR